MVAESYINEIYLPSCLQNQNNIAVDIGGTLIKIVYYLRKSDSKGGQILFKCFRTEKIDEAISFVQNLFYEREKNYVVPRRILATGGGAYLYAEKLKSLTEAELIKKDEIESLIKGVNFLVLQVPFESFTCSANSTIHYEDVPSTDSLFPYILVNIGSGVSIIKVSDYDLYERISGTSLGGGTFWGLVNLLTSATTFDEALALSDMGDNQNVDLLVGDIYGMDYTKVGLSASTIASSCGKIPKMSQPELQSKGRLEEDVSASLLHMISNNIGQVAFLNAQLHGINRIYFGGFFIRCHLITMKKLSFAINFWSKGKMKAFFLRHEGYLGSIGSFLSSEKTSIYDEKKIICNIKFKNGHSFTKSEGELAHNNEELIHVEIND